MQYPPNSILVVGGAKPSRDDAIYATHGEFYVSFVLDRATGEILDVGCNTIVGVTAEFVRQLLVGRRLVEDLPALEAEIRERVDYFLDMVGLTKFQNYYPDQLSASMLQRAAIARAFAVRPEVLLMDEPYGQLDIELRFKLEDELIRLWREVGTTVIFITHNIEEAVYLSGRILVLTNKPTKIKAEIPNDLPRPRDIADPNFVALRNQVTELIKWW